MAGLRRQKINLDDDPLAMLGHNPLEEEDEEEEVTLPTPQSKITPIPTPPSRPNETLPLPSSAGPPKVAATGVVPELPAKKKSIFDDDDDDLLIRSTPVTKVTEDIANVDLKDKNLKPTKQPAVATQSKPTTTNISPSKPTKVEFEGEDLFGYGGSTTSTADLSNDLKSNSSKPAVVSSISPKSTTVKIDFNRDEEDISDLKVAQILEKEGSLDYKLFGRVETTEVVQKRVQKRMNDLDREDDFLRQLDELTTKASVATIAPAANTATPTSSSVEPVTQASTVNPSKPSTDIDISSFDLNAYIAQESSSSGGLFDD